MEYYCNRCHSGFTLEESGTAYFDGEPVTVCPDCGSTDIEEAGRCKVCQEIHPPHQLTHSGACDGCYEDAVNSLRMNLGYLLPWEKSLLEDEHGELDVTKL